MITRRLQATLEARLRERPAVVLTGSRQVGKTTLAQALGTDWHALYLDLESERDRGRLAEPELYLERYLDRLVILDEVHRMPQLFPLLRGLIDRGRQAGRRHGLYLLLGSVSPEVSRQAGQSLAGRASYLELTPFGVSEVAEEERLWLRGGFPESYLAASDRQSLHWRQDFIRTYLERELSLYGARLPVETQRRLWTMLAHVQGELLNLSRLAGSLGLDGRTVARYLDLLSDLYLLRRLPPYEANLGKRLIRSPKLYLRDSGLVHVLLGLEHLEALLGHPVVGASYEGFVLENLLQALPEGVQAFFYRTRAGAEIDLLLERSAGERWAIEVKRSLNPRPSRGFYSALADLKPARALVVYPGHEKLPLGEGLEAWPLAGMAGELAGLV